MSGYDILVFAPHPDDEALGCAGMIYNESKKGRKVKVVLLTNGDADIEFWEKLHNRKPTNEDMREHGRIRQRETISAMALLDIREKDILFLGYPDNGLQEILSSENYTEIKPFKSKFTGLTRTAYENSYHKNASYCKMNLIGDVKDILNQYTPRKVFVTHPLDGHDDHRASGEMIRDVVKQVKKPIYLYGYYISYAPRISNLKATHRLFYKFTRKMKEFTLNEETKQIKEKCLGVYKTQEYILDKIRTQFIKKESYWGLR